MYYTGVILWKNWVDAYEFSNSQPMIIHPQLTRQHIYISEMDKMRNHLAEDVLDKKMLYLMKVSDNTCF